MKYTEAIEMILDGGMFYDSDKQYGYSFVFDDCMDGNMFKMKDIDVDGNWREPSLVPEDFITNDWIVEKNGVIYEEYTPSIKLGFADKINIDVTLPDTIDSASAIKFEFNKPATVTFHCSANLQEKTMIMTAAYEKEMNAILDARTGYDDTVRGFLQALLEKLLIEEEGFNGKRPFGDGGWKAMLIFDLAEAGLVNCKKNEDGEVYEVDEEQGELLLLQAIEYLFSKERGVIG